MRLVIMPVAAQMQQARGRGLIPKTPLGGPSLRVGFMQGWGLSTAFFQFIFSIFRQCRAELACGEIFQGAKARVELGGVQAAQAIERAQKIRGWAVALARVAFEAAGNQAAACARKEKAPNSVGA